MIESLGFICRRLMESRVHLGPVASGRQVARDDHLRQELAARLGILAFDSEFDSALESVIGNRRDAFVVVRGIADYKVFFFNFPDQLF
jgi:hypothetical protein